MENSATDYTMFDHEIFRDDRLSASDLDLLVYLSHLPDKWKIQPTQLADRFEFRISVAAFLKCGSW